MKKLTTLLKHTGRSIALGATMLAAGALYSTAANAGPDAGMPDAAVTVDSRSPDAGAPKLKFVDSAPASPDAGVKADLSRVDTGKTKSDAFVREAGPDGLKAEATPDTGAPSTDSGVKSADVGTKPIDSGVAPVTPPKPKPAPGACLGTRKGLLTQRHELTSQRCHSRRQC